MDDQRGKLKIICLPHAPFCSPEMYQSLTSKEPHWLAKNECSKVEGKRTLNPLGMYTSSRLHVTKL